MNFTKISDEYTFNPIRDGYTIDSGIEGDDEWVMEAFGINL